MTEAASRVPVLWEAFLWVLRIFLVVRHGDHADAAFRADPCADSSACALVHVEQVSTSEALGE